ncbi:hypothetical protein [Hydrogenophaga sp.]|uniref:hypothetical protein n=1 Tax=Hydrogenophaga sp. TaxID=1904254 RepID=UPI003D2D4567
MARENSSQFAPSWYSAFEGTTTQSREQRMRAFVRLWRAFMRARVFIAAVLLALQVVVVVTKTGGPDWLVLLCALHLCASLAVLYFWRPVEQGKPMKVQWLVTIGVDVVVFALLQFFQVGGINYTALFALPVLLASILGPLLLALATAASVTLYLLGEAWVSAPLLSDVSTARFLQTGLTGTGFFLVAVLANQLALRLAREEALAASSQAAARTQAQVNELVIESLSVGVLVVDPHGVVRNANPAAQAMLLGEVSAEPAKLLLSARSSWHHLAALVHETFASGQSGSKPKPPSTTRNARASACTRAPNSRRKVVGALACACCSWKTCARSRHVCAPRSSPPWGACPPLWRTRFATRSRRSRRPMPCWTRKCASRDRNA